MAASVIETIPANDHYCLFCDVDAVVVVYSNGQEVVACPLCRDYKGIVYTGDDEIYDISDDDEGGSDG